MSRPVASRGNADFVNPQCVESCGIKSGKKHVDHYQQVYFAVLDAERQVFIVVLKFVGARVVARAEHLVIILDAGFEEVAAVLVETFGVFGRFIVNVHIGSIAENRCYLQPLVGLQLRHLLF